MQVMMALRRANPSPDWRIFGIGRTFTVKAHWAVARRAPTQGEFRGDQVDAKVSLMPGAARGVCARSRTLVVAPYNIKGETRPREKEETVSHERGENGTD